MQLSGSGLDELRMRQIILPLETMVFCYGVLEYKIAKTS